MLTFMYEWRSAGFDFAVTGYWFLGSTNGVIITASSWVLFVEIFSGKSY